MKELDFVMLINDRPTYQRYGVKKRMIGCIMYPENINGEWLVIFSEDYTAEDIADISVRETDLIKMDDLPPRKYMTYEEYLEKPFEEGYSARLGVDKEEYKRQGFNLGDRGFLVEKYPENKWKIFFYTSNFGTDLNKELIVDENELEKLTRSF